MTVDADALSRSEIHTPAADDGQPALPERFRAKRPAFAPRQRANLKLRPDAVRTKNAPASSVRT
jgi:hypothetical protein